MKGTGLFDEVESIGFGKRGHPLIYILPSDKGLALIGKDRSELRIRWKGGLKHGVFQNKIYLWGKSTGRNIVTEFTLDNGKVRKTADCAELRQDGTFIAYEIPLAPELPSLAESVQRGLEAGFDRVVIVSENKGKEDIAKGNIWENLDMQFHKRVVYRLIREFL